MHPWQAQQSRFGAWEQPVEPYSHCKGQDGCAGAHGDGRVLTTISANRGLPRRPSPGKRGVPIDSQVRMAEGGSYHQARTETRVEDPGRFARWLMALASTDAERSDLTGVPKRTLYHYRTKGVRLTVEEVDAALQHAYGRSGSETRLEDLYPSRAFPLNDGLLTASEVADLLKVPRAGSTERCATAFSLRSRSAAIGGSDRPTSRRGSRKTPDCGKQGTK